MSAFLHDIECEKFCCGIPKVQYELKTHLFPYFIAIYKEYFGVHYYSK